MSFKSITKSKAFVIVVLLVALAFFGAWLSSFNFAVAKNGQYLNQDVDYVCFRVEETKYTKGVVDWRYLNKHFIKAGIKGGKAEFSGPTMFCTPVVKNHLEAGK